MSKQFNILAIGNSFSRDATVFLHDAAKHAGVDVNVVNLYVGGCSLEQHVANLESDDAVYLVEVNGVPTDKYASLKKVIGAADWNHIVTQQSSHDSGWIDTYEPFAGILINYIKTVVPKAKTHLMQTWAYALDSTHPAFKRYHNDQAEMYQRSRAAYYATAEKYSLPVIPCGDVVEELRQRNEFNLLKDGMSVCRDGYHMHLIYGRYLLAAVWLKALFDKDMPEDFIPVNPAEKPADPKKLKLIRTVVTGHFKAAPRANDELDAKHSKYIPLWEYIKHCGDDVITLKHEDLEAILGFSVDNSILIHTKELNEYGYSVSKVSLSDKYIVIEKIPK